jgi:hypothetical protein
MSNQMLSAAHYTEKGATVVAMKVAEWNGGSVVDTEPSGTVNNDFMPLRTDHYITAAPLGRSGCITSPIKSIEEGIPSHLCQWYDDIALTVELVVLMVDD